MHFREENLWLSPISLKGQWPQPRLIFSLFPGTSGLENPWGSFSASLSGITASLFCFLTTHGHKKWAFSSVRTSGQSAHRVHLAPGIGEASSQQVSWPGESSVPSLVYLSWVMKGIDRLRGRRLGLVSSWQNLGSKWTHTYPKTIVEMTQSPTAVIYPCSGG